MVRAAVAPKDTHVPSLTFRSTLIGLTLATVLSFVNQLLWFKTTPIIIGGFFVQIISFPMGYILSRILPTREFTTFGYTWTLNPGPFSIKEHAIISIFTASASNAAYAIDIVVVENVWYNRGMGFTPAILITLSSMMLGYSYAGLLRELLVYPAAMIWPVSLVSVTLFRSFHEKTPYLYHTSRTKIFWIVFACAFVYQFFPGFIMPVLTFVPVLCLAAPNNVIAHQVGDSFHGLGVLNFTFDWTSISTIFGSPIAIPWYLGCNMFAAFVLTMWIVTPAAYYNNVWGSGNLPIYSSSIFRANGSLYNTSEVMDADGAFGSEKALNHSKDIYNRLRHLNVGDDDVHARLMRRYPEVPRWWYAITLITMLALGITACEVYDMLPWYYMLLAIAMSITFLVPVGIVQALSNQQPGLNVITELVIGFALPGNPLANVTFKLFGYISVTQALGLVADQKIGHYMKIPPRHVFIAQLSGTIVTAFVQCGTAIWIMGSVKDICMTNAAWMCNNARLFYAASIIWGLVGPQRLFGSESDYHPLIYLFIIGALLPIPVWYLQQRYPNSFWRWVNLPVFFAGLNATPPAASASVVAWFLVCFVFQFIIHRYRYGFWQRYAFAISAALDSSAAFATVVIYLAFTLSNISMPDYWGSKTNLCPLANWRRRLQKLPGLPPAVHMYYRFLIVNKTFSKYPPAVYIKVQGGHIKPAARKPSCHRSHIAPEFRIV
ncbi:OPT superfamily oligopeptide transporter [Linderina pennispora]|uniref:OPT superfamily oligopeptide transporter n=1 Tax=Linderina pennispora TaxID=61395 RepID=A0A1Y1W697_9FUNG|nr:OPT superfamily oligopeptide transporter [Linderina pennispora]ORX69070.1 OPT superfamily oligopeptide transporter [Linderina pennispora]